MSDDSSASAKLSLFSANRGRRFARQVSVFLCQGSIAQARVDLTQETVDLQIDSTSLLGAGGGFLRVRTRLRIGLHAHLQPGALVPHGANLWCRLNGTIKVPLARGKVVALGEESPVVIVEEGVVKSSWLIDLQPFAICLIGAIQVSNWFQVQGQVVPGSRIAWIQPYRFAKVFDCPGSGLRLVIDRTKLKMRLG